MLEMSRQFINKDRVNRMSGDDGEAIESTLVAGELKQIKGFMDIKVIPNSSRVIDEQAEAMKLNAVADRFISDKGPFQNIPPEVFDKFLLLYLQRYGIHDAYYWVRAIREHRAKMAKNPAQPAASGGADLAEAMAGVELRNQLFNQIELQTKLVQ
jgi:hypothetical protein